MMNGHCQQQERSKAHCRIHYCIFHTAVHKSVNEVIGRTNISSSCYEKVSKDAEQREGYRDKMWLEHIIGTIICMIFFIIVITNYRKSVVLSMCMRVSVR